MLLKPIIIVGSPRSGTTLLGNLLKHHPEVTYLEEPRLVWKYGNDHKSDWLTAADAGSHVRDHIRNTFELRVGEGGGRRMVEKTPSNALRLPFVDRVFPDAQFVHILRDGYQSVLSIRRFWLDHRRSVPRGKLVERLKELNLRRAPYYAKELFRKLAPRGLAGPPVWGPRLPGMEGMLKDLELLEVCCLQWRMCVEATCQFGRSLPAERYFECRLEDMSESLIRDVFAFTGLAPADEVWDAFEQNFDPTQPSRRTPDASEEDLETIRRWIEPTVEWLEGRRSRVGT